MRNDHDRLCQGREYTCTCGYDDERDAEIGRLQRLVAFSTSASKGDEGGDGWLPIDSAPRDASDVLVFCEDTGEQFVAWWNDRYDGFIFATSNTGRAIGCVPTHWRPLPAPPASLTTEGNR